MTVEAPTGRLSAGEERVSTPKAGGAGAGARSGGWLGAAAALLGMAVVWYVFGGHILPPPRTGWMLTGTIGPDPVQYWLGFTFFKRSPWMWPPGLNPAYGLELGSSIFYADAIPLLAFFFKALHPLVEVSQYWGLWLFACGALQGMLAWKLLGLATDDPLARLAGSVLFVMQPTLLNRLGGHFALSAHFLILAGLWLCLAPGAWPRRALLWAGLVLATSLIHSYILPMVLGLWAADWLARAVMARQRPALLATEALAVPLSGAAGLWAAGFFVLSAGHGGQGARYGEMQLDLLAPFDPSFWGAFLPDLPNPDHLEVGSSYAGLGVLLLLVAAGFAWLRRPWRGLSARWPLVLSLLAMLAVAITHRPSIGGWQFTLFELPPALVEPAAALRASERFLWPLAYALLLAAVAALAHGLGGRRAGQVLAVLVVVQFADLQPGFARLRHFFPAGPAEAPLRLSDPFWAEAARHYRRVRVVPNGNQAPNWEEVAVYAATMGLETDGVYLARIDPARVAALNAETAARLAEGRYEPATLYALGDEAALVRARQGMDPSRDFLMQFDRVTVLAPDWWRRTGRAPPPAPPAGR
ncbi:hypothetical protein GCM10009416_21550 [Craurococcus roseus]|uniref:Uncharacterized protein n=1 Tax=Craurococcus roseus TaxID=77585 RepID=A0ABN1F5E3_9PROT